jgi:WD40 repeat protein
LLAAIPAIVVVVGAIVGGIYFFSRPEEKPVDKGIRVENAKDSIPPTEARSDPKDAGQPTKVELLRPVNDNPPELVDARTEEMLLGKWRCVELGGAIFDFQKDGMVTLSPGAGRGPVQNGNYRIIDEQAIEMSGLTNQTGRMEMLLTEEELELIFTPSKDQVQVSGSGKDQIDLNQPITVTLHFKRADKETVVPEKPDKSGVVPPPARVIGTDPAPRPNPVRPVTGIRPRDRIVGKWYQGTVSYEFTSDGRFIAEGLGAFRGTYEFQDDRTLTIRATPPDTVGSMTGLWNVFVTSTSLRLSRPGESPTRAPLFRRVRPATNPVVIVNPRPAPVSPAKPETPGEPWPRVKSARSSKKLVVLEELQIDNGEPVNCVALSPDAKLLAACWDKVHLWDVTMDPPRERASFHAHSFLTRSVAFSPDGKLLATGGSNRVVRLWDVSGVQPLDLGELKGHLGTVNAVAFSPDGKYLSSGSDDKTVILWDLGTKPPREAGVLRMADKLARAVYALAWSANSKQLASAGYGHWQTWDVARKQVTLRDALNVKAHEMPLAFSPDGRLLAIGGDNLLKVCTGRTGPILSGHVGKVRSVAFTPDGRYLASAGEDGRVILWDVATNKRALVKEVPGKLNGAALPQVQADFKTSPDPILVCANQNSTVHVLHLGYGTDDVAAAPKTPANNDAKPAADDPAKAEAEATRKLKLVKQIIEDSKEERRKQNTAAANELTKKAKEGFEKLIKDFPGTKAAAEAEQLLEKLN